MQIPAPEFVVDCSVTLPWYFEDETSLLSDKVMNLLARAAIWVPAVWRLEFVNALLVAERRGRMDAQKRIQILEQAERLPLRVDTDRVTLCRINEIAASHGLTSYDAAYLELALRRGVPLATLDEELLSAARKIKHPIIS